MSIVDSGGSTNDVTPNIAITGVWQNVNWDISGVADGDKDAVNSIVITIDNADSANTFYIDNMFGQ